MVEKSPELKLKVKLSSNKGRATKDVSKEQKEPILVAGEQDIQVINGGS